METRLPAPTGKSSTLGAAGLRGHALLGAPGLAEVRMPTRVIGGAGGHRQAPRRARFMPAVGDLQRRERIADLSLGLAAADSARIDVGKNTGLWCQPHRVRGKPRTEPLIRAGRPRAMTGWGAPAPHGWRLHRLPLQAPHVGDEARRAPLQAGRRPRRPAWLPGSVATTRPSTRCAKARCPCWCSSSCGWLAGSCSRSGAGWKTPEHTAAPHTPRLSLATGARDEAHARSTWTMSLSMVLGTPTVGRPWRSSAPAMLMLPFPPMATTPSSPSSQAYATTSPRESRPWYDKGLTRLLVPRRVPPSSDMPHTDCQSSGRTRRSMRPR